MIPYYIAYIILGIVGFILQPILLFPDVVISPAVITALSQVGQFINVVDNIIPHTIGALFVAISGMVSIEIMIFGYKFIKWIYTKIPGVS
jgi:hypothetical protein